MPQIPLIIIGAGPAGLSTALHLLALDRTWADRMVVLDRAAHPRHKLCGGGVTRLGLRRLRSLGLPDPLPIPQAPVRDARFIYYDRTVHVHGRPEFIVFHRQELDDTLARTARERGVRIHENVRVREIRRDGDGVTVVTDAGEYRGAAVVGADGSKGISRRYAGAPAHIRRGVGARRAGTQAGGISEPQANRRFAVRPLPYGTHLAKVSNLRKVGAARVARLLEVVQPAAADAEQFLGEYARFDFTPTAAGLQGYTWDFPSRVDGAERHNRGVYDARIAPARPKAPLPDLLHRALEASEPGPGGAEVEGHPIHWFSPANLFSGDRLILAGDAAGAEPLFGEGIAPALEYGKIAAQAVVAAFRTGDFRFRDYKRRILFSELGAYLMFRWWVAWWSYRLSGQAWFMKMVWAFGRVITAVTNRRISNLESANRSDPAIR